MPQTALSDVLRQSAGPALRQLAGRALAWWLGELRAMVPPGLARRLAAPVGGEKRVRLAPDATLAGTLPRGAAAVLELDPALVFLARLELPEAAEANLAAILQHQVGLLVPLDATELTWAHAVAGRDRARSTIQVELAVVRRQTLAQAMAAARDAGLTLLRIEAPVAGRNFVFGATAAKQPSRRLQRGLEVAALLCLAAAFGLRALAGPTEPDAAELARLRQDAAAAAALRQQVDRLSAPVALLRERIAAAAPLAVLEELTRLLPDEAWLTGFSLRGAELEIIGTAPSAAALIPLIEASALLEGPAFRSALTVNADGRESFTLTARVRPQP